MFKIIQAHEYEANASLLEQMYRLRKRVFADQLAWKVPHDGVCERDEYDGLRPAYLVWCDAAGTTLYGSARLMPTTAPTLLLDTFHATMPKDVDLCAPGIWECTRLCIDEAAIERDFPAVTAKKAFSTMLVAICEAAHSYGLETIISNHEPHVARLYRAAGATFDELGRADGYGKRPVCCSAFEISDASLARMRSAVGIEGALLVDRYASQSSTALEHLVARSARPTHRPTDLRQAA